MVTTLRSYLQLIRLRAVGIKARYPGLSIRIDELIRQDRLTNDPKVIGFETTFAYDMSGKDVRIICTDDGKKCDIIVHEGTDIDAQIRDLAWEVLIEVYGLRPEDLNQGKFAIYERQLTDEDWKRIKQRDGQRPASGSNGPR